MAAIRGRVAEAGLARENRHGRLEDGSVEFKQEHARVTFQRHLTVVTEMVTFCSAESFDSGPAVAVASS